MDLFDKRSKKEQLRDWMISSLSRGRWLSTSSVIEWGINNYYNRSLRTSQELCAAGYFRRMTDAEKKRHLPYEVAEDYWVENNFC